MTAHATYRNQKIEYNGRKLTVVGKSHRSAGVQYWKAIEVITSPLPDVRVVLLTEGAIKLALPNGPVDIKVKEEEKVKTPDVGKGKN